MNNQQDNNLPHKLADIASEVRLAKDELALTFDKVLSAAEIIGKHLDNHSVEKEALLRIFETGSTQDVIRQRLDKILRIVARIENPDLPEDDALLSGPQSGEGALAQDDINRLMSEDDG